MKRFPGISDFPKPRPRGWIFVSPFSQAEDSVKASGSEKPTPVNLPAVSADPRNP